MTFANPIWLAVGAVACLGLIALAVSTSKKRARSLRIFAGSRLSQQLTVNLSPGRRRARAVLLVMAVGCLFTALARPQWGTRWEEVSRRGIDILLALDTSRSMLAPDVVPNRLERAKLGIHDFVGKLEGDRVGLMPFAGEAFMLCPLTLDYDAFRQSLDAVDTRIVPKVGTNVAAVIRSAAKALEKGSNHKILVLITDGEDLEGEGLLAAREAADKGITIHTVGVGTPNGEAIPLGGDSFVKNASGEVVRSKLDEESLREIAGATGGIYAPLGSQGQGLESIYREKLSLVPKEELSQRSKEVKIDRFQWPLGLAVVLLVVEMLMGTVRRGAKPARMAGAKAARASAAVTATLLAVGLAIPAAQAADAGEPVTTGDPRLTYNQGTEFYQNEAWDKATESFQEALHTDDVGLQKQAYYNLGNALYRAGQAQRQEDDRQATIKQWEKAVKAYDDALALNQADEDARFNRELVQKKIEELKQRDEQDKKDQQDQQDQKNQQDQQDKQDQKNQQDKQDQQNQEDQQNQQDQQNQENQQDQQSGQDGKSAEKDQQEESDAQKPGKDSAGDKKEQENKKEGEDQAKPGNDSKDEKSKPEEEKPGGSDPKEKENEKENQDPGKTAQHEPGQEQEAGKPSAAGAGEAADAKEPASKGTQPQDQVAQPSQAPRQAGEMSREEAVQLLESLSDQEGRFRPQFQRGQGRSQQNRSGRDW